MRFEKWQALGNDYVIIEAPALPWTLTPGRIRRICDPHFGIGSDGVLLIDRPGDPDHVAELRIFNPDGSEAELSGNGSRQAILYLRQHGWTGSGRFSILTVSGPVTATILSERTCSVAMGRASTRSAGFPSGGENGRGTVRSDGRDWKFRHVSIGNPQCAIRIGNPDELSRLDLSAIGPGIEHSGLFPDRTNVSFYTVDGSRLRARVFERGAGETLSSGTGACGAAVAAFLDGAPAPITVELDGGELTVELTAELDLTLTGSAEPILAGELSPVLITELATPGTRASVQPHTDLRESTNDQSPKEKQ